VSQVKLVVGRGGLLVGDAEQVPGAVVVFDKGVVVDVPGLRFADRWVIDELPLPGRNGACAGYLIPEMRIPLMM